MEDSLLYGRFQWFDSAWSDLVKHPYSAYQFRRIMQQHFLEAYTNPPKENPLE